MRPSPFGLLVTALLLGAPALALGPGVPPLITPDARNPCFTGTVAGAAVYDEGFEAGAAGWTTRGTTGRPDLWHATTFAGNGSANDALLHGGPGRLYYGIENAQGGTYNTSRRPNEGDMRSPLLRAPAGPAAVLVNTKWHVEWDRPWLVDSMQLGYAVGDGARVAMCSMGNGFAGDTNYVIGYGYYQTSPFGQAAPTGCEYSLESPQNPCRAARDRLHEDIVFDLAPAIALWEPRWFPLPAEAQGRDVRVSLWFQTGDAIVDDAMGWMVDDVQVVALGP
ncbi:MAG: hypothetical protein LC624_07040 [Halobacteriales archaeon]|nr:hypothetical protein [Halobacteriales archaeon]